MRAKCEQASPDSRLSLQSWTPPSIAIQGGILGPYLSTNPRTDSQATQTQYHVNTQLYSSEGEGSHQKTITLYNSSTDDTTRCRLSTIPGLQGSDYINANFIDVSLVLYPDNAIKCHYGEDCFHIAGLPQVQCLHCHSRSTS